MAVGKGKETETETGTRPCGLTQNAPPRGHDCYLRRCIDDCAIYLLWWRNMEALVVAWEATGGRKRVGFDQKTMFCL